MFSEKLTALLNAVKAGDVETAQKEAEYFDDFLAGKQVVTHHGVWHVDDLLNAMGKTAEDLSAEEKEKLPEVLAELESLDLMDADWDRIHTVIQEHFPA